MSFTGKEDAGEGQLVRENEVCCRQTESEGLFGYLCWDDPDCLK